MKGVIVQTGEPKSIVFLNNGEIKAIPTPVGCYVGMVVTVKYRNPLRILLIILAAVILIALGVVIGVNYGGRTRGSPADTPSLDSSWPGGRGHGHGRMMRHP